MGKYKSEAFFIQMSSFAYTPLLHVIKIVLVSGNILRKISYTLFVLYI